jgi:hypothetical protein
LAVRVVSLQARNQMAADMKFWLAIVSIVLFAMGFVLLRWPRQEIKQIIAHLGAREIIGFVLLGIAILMIGWARYAIGSFRSCGAHAI